MRSDIWQTKIKNLIFTDQSDPRQNLMANQIIDTFFTSELGEPLNAQFRKFLPT